jgi:hypothetical protein
MATRGRKETASTDRTTRRSVAVLGLDRSHRLINSIQVEQGLGQDSTHMGEIRVEQTFTKEIKTFSHEFPGSS